MAILSGKTALLTGALGTLGRAQAETLAQAGAMVLLLDRPEADHGDALASGLIHGLLDGDFGRELSASASRADLLAAGAAVDVAAAFQFD